MPLTINSILITFFSFLCFAILVSCGKNEDDPYKTQVRLKKVHPRNVSDGSLGIMHFGLTSAGVPENSLKEFGRFYPDGNSTQIITLENELWKFAAIEFSGSFATDGLTTKCDYQEINLTGSSMSIEMGLSRSNCANENFGPSEYSLNYNSTRDRSAFNSLVLYNCSQDGLESVLKSTDDCIGYTSSSVSRFGTFTNFRVTIKVFDLTGNSYSMYEDVSTFRSECFAEASSGDKIYTGLPIPYGSSNLPFLIKIQGFSTSEACLASKITNELHSVEQSDSSIFVAKGGLSGLTGAYPNRVKIFSHSESGLLSETRVYLSK